MAASPPTTQPCPTLPPQWDLLPNNCIGLQPSLATLELLDFILERSGGPCRRFRRSQGGGWSCCRGAAAATSHTPAWAASRAKVSSFWPTLPPLCTQHSEIDHGLVMGHVGQCWGVRGNCQPSWGTAGSVTVREPMVDFETGRICLTAGWISTAKISLVLSWFIALFTTSANNLQHFSRRYWPGADGKFSGARRIPAYVKSVGRHPHLMIHSICSLAMCI